MVDGRNRREDPERSSNEILYHRINCAHPEPRGIKYWAKEHGEKLPSFFVRCKMQNRLRDSVLVTVIGIDRYEPIQIDFSDRRYFQSAVLNVLFVAVLMLLGIKVILRSNWWWLPNALIFNLLWDLMIFLSFFFLFDQHIFQNFLWQKIYREKNSKL